MGLASSRAIIRNIIVENLKFIYPGTQKDVVGGLNATFSDGWTGIVGQNGCGKSTLLTIQKKAALLNGSFFCA